MQTARLLLSSVLLVWTGAAQPAPGNTDGTPLLTTTLQLQMARSRILEGRHEDAARSLRAAARSLAAYQAQSHGPHGWEAQYVREQLLDYAGRTSWESAVLLDRIDYLWLPPLERWYQGTTR